MKVLIAEDDPVSRRMLQATLDKWGYEVVACSDGVEAWEALQRKEAPQLAILDWMMPGMDGLDVCRKVRQGAREPYIYILLLTAKDQKTDLVEGMDAGADDYLSKPFNSHELQVRLRAGKRILDLQEELIAARETLRVQATHDSLTGLWNRAAILDILKRELARARRERTAITIIMVDLDHFKRINDTYGHPAGDTVLREAARRMQLSLRAYDGIGRYGGEEFLIVLSKCDAACAVRLGERMGATVRSEAVQIPEGTISVTCSIGVAVSEYAYSTDADALVRAADAALYRAKSGGRNRVELATMEELLSTQSLG